MPNLSQGITHAVENFRHRVNGMRSEGHTALWDALALANDQLSDYARQFPNAKKRIICISDGEDTKSNQRSCDVSINLAVSLSEVKFCHSVYTNASIEQQRSCRFVLYRR
jgi:Mg-chelatase subunit ChlD